MDIREVFAINVRRLRQAKGLSQEALADEAGMDRTYISALERGVYSASLTTVGKLAKVLDVVCVTCGWAGRDKTSRAGFCSGVEKARKYRRIPPVKCTLG